MYHPAIGIEKRGERRWGNEFMKQATQPDAVARGGGSWSCVQCTFANHPALTVCEMCDTAR